MAKRDKENITLKVYKEDPVCFFVGNAKKGEINIKRRMISINEDEDNGKQLGETEVNPENAIHEEVVEVSSVIESEIRDTIVNRYVEQVKGNYDIDRAFAAYVENHKDEIVVKKGYVYNIIIEVSSAQIDFSYKNSNGEKERKCGEIKEHDGYKLIGKIGDKLPFAETSDKWMEVPGLTREMKEYANIKAHKDFASYFSDSVYRALFHYKSVNDFKLNKIGGFKDEKITMYFYPMYIVELKYEEKKYNIGTIKFDGEFNKCEQGINISDIKTFKVESDDINAKMSKRLIRRMNTSDAIAITTRILSGLFAIINIILMIVAITRNGALPGGDANDNVMLGVLGVHMFVEAFVFSGIALWLGYFGLSFVLNDYSSSSKSVIPRFVIMLVLFGALVLIYGIPIIKCFLAWII